MSYNMNDENVCNDCGVRLVQCDMCGCCSACCDCDDDIMIGNDPDEERGTCNPDYESNEHDKLEKSKMSDQHTLITGKTRKTYFGAKCPDCKKVIRLKGATWNTNEDYVTYKYSCTCGCSTQYLHGPAQVIAKPVDLCPGEPQTHDEIPF